MAEGNRKIMIVGCGPGSAAYLTPAARAAVAGAQVLIGAARLLALFPDGEAERIVVGTDTEMILGEITRRQDRMRIAVLVTGDPGLFSLAAPIIRRFGREACEVVPGVSAIQTAFARLGLGWQDARIISAHAADPGLNAEELASGDTIAILGGDKEFARRLAPLADALRERGYRIFACTDLTMPEERVYEIGAGGLEEEPLSARTIILIVRKELL
jgi:precorrin-6y C5,15-methyltransferase (decarboxylating) CbiE subunit